MLTCYRTQLRSEAQEAIHPVHLLMLRQEDPGALQHLSIHDRLGRQPQSHAEGFADRAAARAHFGGREDLMNSEQVVGNALAGSEPEQHALDPLAGEHHLYHRDCIGRRRAEACHQHGQRGRRRHAYYKRKSLAARVGQSSSPNADLASTCGFCGLTLSAGTVPRLRICENSQGGYVTIFRDAGNVDMRSATMRRANCEHFGGPEEGTDVKRQEESAR